MALFCRLPQTLQLITSQIGSLRFSSAAGSKGKVRLNSIVRADDSGMRLDRYIAKTLDIHPGLIHKLLRKRRIAVHEKRDGARLAQSELATGFRVKPGMVIKVLDQRAADEASAKADGTTDNQTAAHPIAVLTKKAKAVALKKLPIVYQDDGVLVVDKPSGLSTQRDGTNKKEKDIVGMLAAFADESDQVPRLVHRLDKGTSGLLMLAKTRRVAQQLGEMFRDGEINKTYHAVLQQIEGKESSIKWKEGSAGVISVPLNDSTSKRTRVAKEGDELAKSAQTMVRFMAVSESKDRALVELKPLTGRKHQLRVHCVHSLGGVIVGDDLYVPDHMRNGGFRRTRLHLHMSRLEWRQVLVDGTQAGKQCVVKSPMDDTMKQTCVDCFGDRSLNKL